MICCSVLYMQLLLHVCSGGWIPPLWLFLRFPPSFFLTLLKVFFKIFLTWIEGLKDRGCCSLHGLKSPLRQCVHTKGYSCVRCILCRSGERRVCRAAAADRPAGEARAETRPADTSAASAESPDDTEPWTEPAGWQSGHRSDLLRRCPRRGPARRGEVVWSWSGWRGRGRRRFPSDAPDISQAAAGEPHWPGERAGHHGSEHTGTHLWRRRRKNCVLTFDFTNNAMSDVLASIKLHIYLWTLGSLHLDLSSDLLGCPQHTTAAWGSSINTFPDRIQGDLIGTKAILTTYDPASFRFNSILNTHLSFCGIIMFIKHVDALLASAASILITVLTSGNSVNPKLFCKILHSLSC